MAQEIRNAIVGNSCRGRDRCSAVEMRDVAVVRSRATVLGDINMSIEHGDSIAVTGPNGAGKSTLLKCIAGALRPTSGAIRWFGASNARAPDVRRRIGYAGHDCGLYAELSARENLLFAGRMHGLQRLGDRLPMVLAEAGLESVADRRAEALSRGARQRLAIARALLHDPPLVVLDEPFANLDGHGRQWLEQLFETWRRTERTVVFASHDATQCRALADSIICVSRGRVDPILCPAGPSTPLARSA